MFFSRAITDVGGAASGAAAMTSNLLAGFAMGGPMGLAIGGINALIAAIKEEKTASAEVAKVMLQEQKDFEAAVRKSSKALRDRKLAQEGKSPESEDLKVSAKDLQAKQLEQQAKLNALLARQDALLKQKKDLETKGPTDKTLPLVTQLDNIDAALGPVNDQIQSLKDSIPELIKGADTVGADALGVAGDDIKKATADLLAAEKLLREARGDAYMAGEFPGVMGYDDAHAKSQKGIVDQKTGDDAAKRLSGADAASFDEGNFNLEGQVKATDQQDKLLASVESTTAAAATMGSIMGQAFAGMATGQLTLIEGMKQMVNGIVQIIAKAMIQFEVEAAIAAVKGAQSASMVPFIGPILAISAAAAVFGAMMSYQPSASAAGGFDIGNYNPITQLHAREMVLPAELADNVRNMTGSGGNTYVINALDSKSFYQALRANDGALIKVLDRAAAEGRF
jgi:hypothetical protein